MVQAVGFLDNETAISAGGANNEIYSWNINSGEIIQKIEGVGDRVMVSYESITKKLKR